MIKTHIPDEHEALANAGPLCTLFDSTRSFTKQASASSVYKKLSHALTPPDTHYAVHLVAMGDGEHFGENKNCFPAGTPVRTPHGFKNIEDMQVGDMVLTHKGNIRPVVYVHKNESSADIVSITTALDRTAVRMTDEHPVYMLRSDQFCSTRWEIHEEPAAFVPAKSVRVGDWVHLPLAALDDKLDTHGTGLKKTSTALWIQVVSVDTQVQATPGTVYNLEVEEDHTYVTLFSVHNCDYWPAYWNEKRAHTFVDCGCYYREHRNTDPRKYGIGEVKAAAYNPDMHRIELVVWGEKRKSEEEYEKIIKGEPLSFSMSARVKGDICNCCGNYAVNTRHWCKHMKTAPKQFDPETKKFAYVINDSPTFFDISRVKDPADRLAHYISYHKAASASSFVNSCELAEELGFEQDQVTGFHKVAHNVLMDRLAAVEQLVNADDNLVAQYIKSAKQVATARDFTDAELDTLRKVKPETLFYKMASKAKLMPFFSFAAYVTGSTLEDAQNNSTVKYACAHCMQDMFSRLANLDCGPAADAFSCCSPAQAAADPCASDAIDKVLDNADGIANEQTVGAISGMPVKLSITIMRPAQSRLILVKSAATEQVERDANALATMYAGYIVTALADMQAIKGANFIDNNKLHSVISNYT